MAMPVVIESVNGHFRASLSGTPSIQADGATPDLAVARVRDVLRQAIDQGRLALVEPADYGQTPEEFLAEVYRQRDLEKAAYLAELDAT